MSPDSIGPNFLKDAESCLFSLESLLKGDCSSDKVEKAKHDYPFDEIEHPERSTFKTTCISFRTNRRNAMSSFARYLLSHHVIEGCADYQSSLFTGDNEKAEEPSENRIQTSAMD